MPKSYDVAVIGLGGHGSAALMHAARLGLRAIGLERFDIGHTMGSSHGVHRLFRLAYAEGPHYLPILRRARELWFDLGREIGSEIFVENGVLIAAPEGGGDVAASKATCDEAGLAYEMLDAREINSRYPAFRLDDRYQGLLQPQSGFVFCDRAIAAHVELAMLAGADIKTRAKVLGMERSGSGLAVRTEQGTVLAGAAIVCAGAWTPDLFPDLAPLHVVGRRVLGFFAPRRPQDFAPSRCPAYSLSNGQLGIYGFPIAGFPGVKIGRDGHLGESGDPDRLSRDTTRRDEDALRAGLEAFLRDVDGPALALRACVVTMTPDEDFIIDHHPGMANVQIVSACSGHGFKMASAIGEIAAIRAAGLPDAIDLEPFRLRRFADRIHS